MQKTIKYGEKTKIALGLWVKLARATATLGKVSSNSIKSFGLTEPQFAILECLGHKGPLTLSAISSKMLVSNGNVTCVVNHLENIGLAERYKGNNDGRSRYVRLTSKGQQLFKLVFKDHAMVIENAASVLPIREQITLSRLLKKLGLSIRARDFVSAVKIDQLREKHP